MYANTGDGKFGTTSTGEDRVFESPSRLVLTTNYEADGCIRPKAKKGTHMGNGTVREVCEGGMRGQIPREKVSEPSKG